MKKETDWQTINEDIIAFKIRREEGLLVKVEMLHLRQLKVQRRELIINELLGYE